MLASVTTIILLRDPLAFNAFRFWIAGSLAGRDLSLIADLWPFIALGIVLALASGRMLNALSLGEDVARSLGENVNRARIILGLAIMLLAGAATAIAGPIAFLGLTVPHAARALTGPDYRWVMPYSAVLAAMLLVGSDIVGRIAAPPGELQVGVVTALIGAPFFVALVRRRKVAEL
jgi:iron complex transport system permease protein